jgi:hypothetical protein
MFVGYCEHGAYLASTPTAFLDDLQGKPQALPACSSGLVYADRHTTSAYDNPPAQVEEITPALKAAAYEQVQKALQEGEKKFPDIRKDFVAPLFTSKTCLPSALLTYELVYELQKQNRVSMKTVRVPDDFGGDAPKFLLSWKE